VDVAEPWRAAAPAGPPRPGPSTALLAVTLLLTALNLRGAVSSVGPVLRDMQLDLGMSDSAAGVLTTLPAFAFGFVGLLTAHIGRRMGTERALLVALALISTGLLVRVIVPGVGLLLVTSLLALIGIAVANVLVPVAVKSWFPDDVGKMTGWYSTALTFGVAVPAATTVPIAEAFGGWRVGLGVWALPALVALLPWALIARSRRRPPTSGLEGARPSGSSGTPPDGEAPEATTPAAGSVEGAVRDGPVVGQTSPPVAVHRQLRAWALTVFFGLQALEAYTTMGWLPAILQDAGVSPGRAGVMLAVTMGLGAPISLVIPRLAARSPDQRPWVVGLTVMSVAAYIGLIVAPASAPWVWSILLGIGLGAFPLVLVLIGLRAATTAGTVALSSLVQGVGYLVAALGPVTIGVLHERTGGWVVPLLVLLGLLVPKFVAGLIAAAPGTVDGPVAGPDDGRDRVSEHDP
jgi:MFS transporter, CP family, cyanate transporter